MSGNVTVALDAMQLVAQRSDPMGPVAVGAVADALGMSLSSASRMCSALERIGLLARTGGHGTYRLGPRAIQLSGRAAAPVATSVQRAVARLAQQTGETVCVAGRRGDGVTIVALVPSAWTLNAGAELGERIDDEGSALLRGATGATDDAGGCIESAAGLAVELALPICDHEGRCVGAIGVRMPRKRLASGGTRAARAIGRARTTIEHALVESARSPRRVDRFEASSGGALTALEAADRVLWHLASGPDSVAGVARGVGLRADRARRIVESCCRSGLVRLDADTHEAMLSWSVHGWHRAVVDAVLRGLSARLVDDTARATGVSASITVLDGTRSVTVAEALRSPGEGLRMMSWLGRPCSLLHADGGPTLLMEYPAEDVEAMLSGRRAAAGVSEFLARARRVASDGVLAKASLDEFGQIAVSAPVRDASGAVAAAACLVGGAEAVRPRVSELKQAAVQLAAQVSELLGWRGFDRLNRRCG